MKVAASLVYLFTFIIYLQFGGDTYFWGGVHIITQLLFMTTLCGFILHPKKNTRMEQLFLEYIVFITLLRVAYTVLCVVIDTSLRIYNIDVFLFVLCATFAIFLTYCAMNYKSLNK